MASIGKNATFFIKSQEESANGGGLLGSLLGDIPEWLFGANARNEALNGVPLAASVSALVSGILNQEPAHDQTKADKKPPQPLPESDYLSDDTLSGATPEPPTDHPLEVIDLPQAPKPVESTDLGGREGHQSPDDDVELDKAPVEEVAADEDEDAAASPELVNKADEVIVNVVEEAKLDEAEKGELTQVVANLLADPRAHYNDGSLEELVGLSVKTIKDLHAAGKKVSPKEIAKTILDTDVDGEASEDEIVAALSTFAKKALGKRERK
jgi:hypothetical protein